MIVEVNASFIKALIDQELSSCSDRRVVDYVRELLVEPESSLREWDYGESGESYECWTVLVEPSGLGIAYSVYGFGPKKPWGLIRVKGSGRERSMGLDCGWHPSFLDAFFDSAAEVLTIWRVFREVDGEASPGKPISPESCWDATWKEIMILRESDSTAKYHIGHSVNYGRT